MKEHKIVFRLFLLLFCGTIVFGLPLYHMFVKSRLFYSFRRERELIQKSKAILKKPDIRPDYSDTVIPFNIAPLNFLIEEKGTCYYLKVYSKHGKSIEIFCETPKINIPENHWHKLLHNNKSEQLYFEIFVKNKNNQWDKFSAISNKIAPESIDKFLVYRKIDPLYNTWKSMGIYQRNLHNFDEIPVLTNRFDEDACINCHTFCANHPDIMSIATRSAKHGSNTLLVQNGKIEKIAAKFSYTSWHPTGKLALFSINDVKQFFHSTRSEVRDVIDMDSLLAYYLVDSKIVKTVSVFSKKDRLETYPAWSPDGGYLYFCSADRLSSKQDKFPPSWYDKVKYDLVRISYDIENDQWGNLETILTAQDTGLSILEPRISPDGRWLLFCMCDYGAFPVYQKSSDLYLMDLKTAQKTGQYEYHRLNINSDQSESWHSFSSNSRWIAFSSKRDYDVFTRIYISYIDENGKVYKPIILPQKDPTFYDSHLKTFSVPELIVGPVRNTNEKLSKAIRNAEKINVDLPITMATPRAGMPPDPWQERE